AVKVRFQLDVELSDVKPPTSLKMSAHGKAPGSGVDVSTMLEIELIPPNRSRLKWSASSEVRGTVASVGARLLKGTAQKLTESFWDKFARRVGEAGGSKQTSAHETVARDERSPGLPRPRPGCGAASRARSRRPGAGPGPPPRGREARRS